MTYAKCAHCIYRISTNTDDWEEAMAEHLKAHEPPRCKIAGCERQAVDKAGMYAKLCAEHKHLRKSSRQPANTTNGHAPVPAATLVELAAAVERARGLRAAADMELEQATAALLEALA